MCVGSHFTGPPGLVMVGDEEGPWTSEQNRESRYLNSTLGMDIRGNEIALFSVYLDLFSGSLNLFLRTLSFVLTGVKDQQIKDVGILAPC